MSPLLSLVHPAAADSFSHFSPSHCLSVNHPANSCDTSCEVLWELWQRFLGCIWDLVVEWLTSGWHDEERLSSSAEQPLRNDSLWLQLSLFYTASLSSASAWTRKGLDACLLCGFSLLITCEGWLHFLWNITRDTSHFRAVFPPTL